mgnify:FL=1
MKKIVFIFTISLLAFKLSAQKKIEGIWIAPKHNTHIEIYEKSDAYYGKIISSHNPDTPIGETILRSFTFRKNKWKGTMYCVKK